MDYLLLLSTIILGALSVFLFKLYEPRHVKLLNAFTGAYLLSLTLLSKSILDASDAGNATFG